jgi:hypothetical protein
MKKRSLWLALLVVALVPSLAFAQDSNALIDVLVCKKILTPKEADCIRADLIKEKEKSSADKIKISGPVTELSIYGDVRLRYQYDNLDPQTLVRDVPEFFFPRFLFIDPGHGDQRSRWRFRLRLSADFKLKDNWFGGVQLQTSQFSDSANQTFDGGFRNYGIYISRAYVGWNATDWFTLVAGKQPNPFYTTDLMWDPDINPSGLVEMFKFHKLFSCGEEETIKIGPDGKTVLSATCKPIECPWTLTLIAGQFIFDDNQEYNIAGANTDAYLFEEQLVFSYKFCNDVKFTLAPAYLTYNSAQINTVFNQQGFAKIINDTGTDALPPGFGETRNLSIIQLPGDVSFKICGLKTKLIWDGTYNTNGAKRVNDIYVFPIFDRDGEIVGYEHVAHHSKKDDFAWLVGLQLGENVRKGDWSLLVNYREVGLAAVDPNLNDSDWMLSRLNMRGWKVSLAYNFTDAVLAQLTGMTGDNLRPNLIGGQTTRGARLADANSIQVVQFDLNVKF